MKRVEEEDELENKEMRFQKIKEKRKFQAELENKQTLEEKVKQLREEGRLEWESIKRKERREIKEIKEMVWRWRLKMKNLKSVKEKDEIYKKLTVKEKL